MFAAGPRQRWTLRTKPSLTPPAQAAPYASESAIDGHRYVMLHEAHAFGGCMSRGIGPRMVVELDPELKRTLYAELAREGLTFKEWLTCQARRYLADRQQPLLFAADTANSAYGGRPKP